jgi:hypothetical protein
MPLLFTPEELNQMTLSFDDVSYKPAKKEELDKIVRDFETSFNLHTILQTYIEIKRTA